MVVVHPRTLLSPHVVVICAGPIPEELGGLDKLESLLLGENKLTGECVRTCVVGLKRRP